MLDKEEPPGRPEHPMRFTESALGVGDTAQCPRRYHRVDAVVFQRDCFGRPLDQFDRTRIALQISPYHREQLWRGIKADKAFYFVRVIRQIKPRPNADFEHATLGCRNDPAAIGGEFLSPHRQIDQ